MGKVGNLSVRSILIGVISDIKTAFEDLEDDHSKFFILKPPKSGDTAQRAMAAYFKEFTYKAFLFHTHVFDRETRTYFFL